MKKLFKAYQNDGGWGGFRTQLIIAETAEEAVELSDYTPREGLDTGAWEHNLTKDLRISNKEDYDVEITIVIKEKEVSS
jgi:hypothetical protein